MPSSKDRQRVEIPTRLYDQLKLIAESEERPLTNLLQDLVRLGLASYQPRWIPCSFLSRFTDSARQVLTLAREEAQELHSPSAGTEHLLLGLLREGEGIAATVLHQLWIDHDQVRKALDYIMTTYPQSRPASSAAGPAGALNTGETAAVAMTTGSTPSPMPSNQSAPLKGPGFTPRARTVLALAVDEAQRLHQEYVGTEHLLLALAREGEGLAAGILRTFGALDKVREFTLAEMHRREAPPREDQATM